MSNAVSYIELPFVVLANPFSKLPLISLGGRKFPRRIDHGETTKNPFEGNVRLVSTGTEEGFKFLSHAVYCPFRPFH
jgi:hypothetical protein